MEKKSQLPWYKRKKFYLPVAVVLGVIGVLPSLVSLFGVSIDDEFNPDYYSDPNEPMFKKNKTDCCDAVCRFFDQQKKSNHSLLCLLLF